MKSIDIRCSFCRALFKRDAEREKNHPLLFCAYCGSKLLASNPISSLDTKAVFLKEHTPLPEEVTGSIGRFLLLRSIGRGGMGEVFLAFDTVCGRQVALKRIRPDLMTSPQLRERFVREARITSQLIHPSIIPIYDIHIDHETVYYTMPLVAGKTLKEILREAVDEESSSDHRTSIPTLIRLFLGVVQAVAYAHSKGVLHRDVKPENVIIGTYGQVIILDWGLTKLIEEVEEESGSTELHQRLTRMAKPVGTVPYMAPERVQGKPASKQTDIYALGVILYQILTLKLPFSRKSMKAFCETWHLEQFVPPEIRSPYRDVPQALSGIVKKCLEPDPKERYNTCDELIDHLESFLEGRSEWFPVKTLRITEKSDWEFQENILLTEHTAITRSSELGDWYSLMISKESFSENISLDITVCLGKSCRGIGFILCIPHALQRRQLTDGYCLWISSSKQGTRPTTLFRSAVSVLEASDVSLAPEETHRIFLQKIDQTISLTINGVQQFLYVSHIPVVGTHVGVLAQDADFDLKSLVVNVGSQNIMVNCLAVPDAFLASQEFSRALAEYRRIGASFSGRAEGREALFRAGVTLLEQGKREFLPKEKEVTFDLARHEFQKLRSTPGAPLEYLGKALVYQTTQEFDEEVKCFELAFRRYKKHPLLRVLEEQVVLRMHESSRQNRVAAYHFICLVIRFLPEIAAKPSSVNLFESMQKYWEFPPFFISKFHHNDTAQHRFCLGLAFWLQKSYVASEIFEELIAMPILPLHYIVDCLFLLVLLHQDEMLQKDFQRLEAALSPDEKEKHAFLLKCCSLFLIEDETERFETCQKIVAEGGDVSTHTLLLLMERTIRKCAYEEVLKLYNIKNHDFHSLEEELASRALEACLWCKKFDTARDLISQFSSERLENEESPLFFWYGCYLAITKGISHAIAHFELALDVSYPHSWVLGACVITGKIALRPKGWYQRAFPYEKEMLLRQLRLYRYLTGDETYASGIELLSKE
jgi:serine/threonine-protein kinase